ncbi:hypothetical protein V6N11_078945 [Hibiscus sabdariffa]|uniref:Uncharacterized protein n=1 Tax=Hibiscus sabdariffa TaxID=183260 RepID=A0ABR2RUG1_9ROSI
MAEAIAFNVITKLSSPLLHRLGLWCNFKDDFQDLKSTVSAIKAVLLDAEERSVTSNLVKDCLEKLKDALYDADDLLDDINTQAQWKHMLSGNKLKKEVRVFFSCTNQVVYGLKMGRKIKAIKARLASIESETKMLNLVERDHPVETPFMARRRRQTHSFVRKDEIIGRENDKAALLKLMLEFQSEEDVFLIPIVGIGGLGKTALAQLVYNDEVEITFEQRYADSINSTFVDTGKQILNRCGGVPLVIRTIAGTLSFKETENEWLSFKDNELARISQKEDVSQSLEEIGFGYFKDLVERSFFQEVEEDGDLRTCKMHDLMHDLVEAVAGRESSILDSNSSASEVDEKCRHISINFSLIHLFNGKKLRTLLRSPNSRVENMSDATWDLIIKNYRCLRVLELDRLNLNTVPASICKLKHLRYLDLSHNYHLKILPKSVSKIQNLQVLKLDHCWRLEELPKKIENLVNLTHLPCTGCEGLTHMPRGIGKLTSLQRLSMFVVDKDGSHGAAAAAAGLSELGGLNSLRRKLTITNMGFVKNVKEEFKAANLKEKQHLWRLVLEWSGAKEDEEKSLEDLRPHPNLKELLVKGWRGDAKFPSWLSLLTNLTDIDITGPSKFKHLPSFAQLPHLKHLRIFDLTQLEYMDDNGPNGARGDSESFFPSLISLTLTYCQNMESWWRYIDADRTSNMAFPCLSSLYIHDCPLTSMPLYPSLDKNLILSNTSSRPLKQTIQMNIAPSISSLPLSKLKYFRVENIEEPDTIIDCLQNMTLLERLDIASCHWLKSLSEWSQRMTSLTKLKIRDCKELDLEGMQCEPLKNLSRLVIRNIPRLVSLPLWLQHLVQLKSLVIKNCSGLRSVFPVFQHLTSLEKLRIIDCTELELSADEIQNFQNCTCLRHLWMENIPMCQHLPKWFRHLTNLKWLYLINLPNLSSLPDEMSCLATLEELWINGIPQLEERCGKDIGADWHKITHIPVILVNGVGAHLSFESFIHLSTLQQYIVLSIFNLSISLTCFLSSDTGAIATEGHLSISGIHVEGFEVLQMMPNVWPFVKLALEKHRQWLCTWLATIRALDVNLCLKHPACNWPTAASDADGGYMRKKLCIFKILSSTSLRALQDLKASKNIRQWICVLVFWSWYKLSESHDF